MWIQTHTNTHTHTHACNHSIFFAPSFYSYVSVHRLKSVLVDIFFVLTFLFASFWYEEHASVYVRELVRLLNFTCLRLGLGVYHALQMDSNKSAKAYFNTCNRDISSNVCAYSDGMWHAMLMHSCNAFVQLHRHAMIRYDTMHKYGTSSTKRVKNCVAHTMRLCICHETDHLRFDFLVSLSLCTLSVCDSPSPFYTVARYICSTQWNVLFEIFAAISNRILIAKQMHGVQQSTQSDWPDVHMRLDILKRVSFKFRETPNAKNKFIYFR